MAVLEGTAYWAFVTSPNTKLSMQCSYCEYKKMCWPKLRTFIYSYGPEYLVDVRKEPKVPEIFHD